MAAKKIKVVFAAAEAAPFVKTGGLADVVGALPKALSSVGCNAIVVLPLYGSIPREGLAKTDITLTVTMGNKTYVGSVFKGCLDKKTDAYFIFQHDLYSRPNPYGDAGGDYPDNDVRFIFFNLAVLELLRRLRFKADVIHVHDWHLGLVPAYLKTLPESDFLHGTASVLSLHNLAYQGIFPAQSMGLTGLPEAMFGPEGVEMYGQLALLKSGILFADALVAVSPAYAGEITGAELGFGLENILLKRKKSLYGILNGIDTREWNPATDTLLPANYTAKDFRGKAACRAALLAGFGLADDGRRPVVGIVGRLIQQKGFDIVAEAAEELMKLDFYLAVLGTGQPEYEEFFRGLRAAHPSRVGVEIGFNNRLAHLIEAGADMFLMPSRFEPCGMNQMYSQAYGTPPIVRATGGLKDSVENWRQKENKGTGFVFKEPTARALVQITQKAVRAFHDKSRWMRIVRNGMKKDFSWEKSARLYLQLYKKVIS